MAAAASPSEAPKPVIDWSAELAKHHRWLRTVVWTRCGSAEDAEEVMQELALAVVKQNSRPKCPDKVAPWLYRLAVRQSLLYRRKLGRRRKLHRSFVDQSPRTEADGPEPDPIQWLLDDERRQLIKTALQQLTTREAELLLLKYTENWSYRQLAAHLGIGISAVEARLHRARGRLRRELAARNVIEVSS